MDNSADNSSSLRNFLPTSLNRVKKWLSLSLAIIKDWNLPTPQQRTIDREAYLIMRDCNRVSSLSVKVRSLDNGTVSFYSIWTHLSSLRAATSKGSGWTNWSHTWGFLHRVPLPCKTEPLLGGLEGGGGVAKSKSENFVRKVKEVKLHKMYGFEKV